jgi:transposase-like protein
MGKNQRIFSREFKLDVCRKIVSGEQSKTHLMRHLKLGAGTIERWIEQYEVRGDERAFDGTAWRVPEGTLTNEGRLKREIEQLKLENEFLRSCLGKLPEQEGTK